MNYGEKIAALRKSKSMTQAELGNELNVTYQAVSKWERGESQPDFGTLSKMAKIFGVPISYFEDEESEFIAPPANFQPQPAMLGVCTVCGKVIYEGDEHSISPKIVCKSCAEIEAQKKQQEKEAADEKRAYDLNMARIEKEKARQEQLGSGFDVKLIISLVLAIAAYVLFTVLVFTNNSGDRELLGFLMTIIPLTVFAIVHAICDFINDLRDVDGPEGYKLSISLIVGAVFAIINLVLFVVLYTSFDKSFFFLLMMIFGTLTSFTFISQYMWGSVVADIFSCGGFTFKMPGFIFSLTVDSILWMIVTKVFLGFISIIVFILTTLLFAIIAIVGSVITFIPCIIIKVTKDKRAA